jgi:hypothetical protein
MPKPMKTTTSCVAVLAALCVGGCASSGLDQQRLVDTQATVSTVEELGAAEHPDVSLHLKYARDQLAAARRLSDEGEDAAAARMLERAHADAQLALAMARTQRSREEAQQAWDEVESLRNQ